MYQYSQFDQQFIEQRANEFRQQTVRFLNRELDEEQFKPLRLMNGLYREKHAPMLRIAIPYGQLSSRQLRKLADIARRFDRGYGHFTTRQNIQFNWVSIESTPDILDELASVQMHAIQSSGNCIRNITADHLAGIASDEIEDPRPYCELIRQWSTLHPEFAYLPRKFKIAVSGSLEDRAAIRVHDIGLQVVRGENGAVGFEVWVGGGLGRTPHIGKVINPFLAKRDLLSYLEAVVRVYNLLGRRDNAYKSRIKILVNSIGIDEFRRLVEIEWHATRETVRTLEEAEIAAMSSHFSDPKFAAGSEELPLDREADYDEWRQQNTIAHKQAGYRIVYVSLKAPSVAPGDASAEQMDALAELADRFSFGQIRTTHRQNLLLPHVQSNQLTDLYAELRRHGLATANVETAEDVICCPGLDYCSLANARSIPVSLGNSVASGRAQIATRSGRYPDKDLRLHERLRAPSCGSYRHSRRRKKGRGVVPAHARRIGGFKCFAGATSGARTGARSHRIGGPRYRQSLCRAPTRWQ